MNTFELDGVVVEKFSPAALGVVQRLGQEGVVHLQATIGRFRPSDLAPPFRDDAAYVGCIGSQNFVVVTLPDSDIAAFAADPHVNKISLSHDPKDSRITETDIVTAPVPEGRKHEGKTAVFVYPHRVSAAAKTL